MSPALTRDVDKREFVDIREPTACIDSAYPAAQEYVLWPPNVVVDVVTGASCVRMKNVPSA